MCLMGGTSQSSTSSLTSESVFSLEEFHTWHKETYSIVMSQKAWQEMMHHGLHLLKSFMICLNSMRIRLENAHILFFLFQYFIREYITYFKGAAPSRLQLPMKQMQARVVHQHLLAHLKCSLSYPSIMPSLCLFLVNLGILICCKFELIQFIQLHQPIITYKLKIK